jgi:hypothetical protein
MNNERKHHTQEEKVTILRRHLIDRQDAGFRLV